MFLLSFLFGQIADYKSQMFSNLRGKAQKVLEIGIGTGPNLKYYAGYEGMKVYGVDPNLKMEKYAREAAKNAGLPAENFEFKQAVWHFIELCCSLLNFIELFYKTRAISSGPCLCY